MALLYCSTARFNLSRQVERTTTIILSCWLEIVTLPTILFWTRAVQV